MYGNSVDNPRFTKAEILYIIVYSSSSNFSFQAIKQYVKQGPLLIDVLMHKPDAPARSFMDALGAFWPGLLVIYQENLLVPNT